jgi:hypothetical protein
MHSKEHITKAVYFDCNVKNPLLLPRRHDFTWLVVGDVHAQCKHLGIPSTVSWVRQQWYWIPQVCQAVKTVISNC